MQVQRLEGKFRSSGGLSEGMIVELVNGQQAQVGLSLIANWVPRKPFHLNAMLAVLLLTMLCGVPVR